MLAQVYGKEGQDKDVICRCVVAVSVGVVVVTGVWTAKQREN